MKYINELREGEITHDVYLCKQVQCLVAKNGKNYLSIMLQDKTGMLDAKVWDINSGGIEDFEALDYIYVEGEVTVFQGTMQLKCRRIRKCHEGEYDPSDYLPYSRYNIDTMYKKLTEYIGMVKEPHLRKLLDSFFIEDEEFVSIFKKHSAAKSVHHGFVGGLLEHTLSVTSLCIKFAEQYNYLNKDLLITAAICHDIGKTRELSEMPLNDYTDDGNLLGHIVMGYEMVGERIEQIGDFPHALGSMLRHCILAHHGEYEFGSPKKPAIAEAIALHFADNLDAKMETMRELLESADYNAEWLGFQRLFESNMRKTVYKED
ncbi:MAG: HD domain-containing protein [Lachnospiraceae bacterium]|nr:HD domain-containing protein [Lachnospiraceae bacterium]